MSLNYNQLLFSMLLHLIAAQPLQDFVFNIYCALLNPLCRQISGTGASIKHQWCFFLQNSAQSLEYVTYTCYVTTR